MHFIDEDAQALALAGLAVLALELFVREAPIDGHERAFVERGQGLGHRRIFALEREPQRRQVIPAVVLAHAQEGADAVLDLAVNVNGQIADIRKLVVSHFRLPPLGCPYGLNAIPTRAHTSAGSNRNNSISELAHVNQHTERLVTLAPHCPLRGRRSAVCDDRGHCEW